MPRLSTARVKLPRLSTLRARENGTVERFFSQNGTSVTDHGTPRPLIVLSKWNNVLSKWNNGLPKRNNSPSKRNVSLSLERSGSNLFSMEPADASALPSEATKISSGTLKRFADNGVCKLFTLSGETMLKDLNTRREVLSDHAQGFSLDRIRRITGVPKTTVKRIIDQSKA